VALRLLEAAVAAELKETVADAQDERVGAFRARTAGGTTRVLRPINHSSFKNATAAEAEAALAESPLYSCLLRPSSKGPEHLTITWKFTEAPLFVHIGVDEHEKDPNSADGAAVLGRRLVVGKRWDKAQQRWIDRSYEDLDELLAMHMERVSAFMRDFVGHSRFRAVPEEMLKVELLDMKAANGSHLPYLLHYGTGRKLGRVAITILVSATKQKTHTEFIAVEPEGFRWEGAVSRTVSQLLADFKGRVVKVMRKRSAKGRAGSSSAGGSSSAASPGRSRWGGVATSPGGAASSLGQPAPAYNAGMAPIM
jgi:transcription elongation factor SPT6